MAARPIPVTFNDREYTFSHGARPRGRGTWAFSLDRLPTSDKLFWHNGTFMEACRAATKHYRALAEQTRMPAAAGLVVWVQP